MKKITKPILKVVIDFDDFSPKNSNLGLLEDLHDHYPNIKITLFTVPWDIRWGDQTPLTESRFTPFSDAVKKSEDWLEIAPHGFTHAPREWEHMTYEDAKKRLSLTEKMFINLGWKWAKIFKAPQWLISEEAKRAVTEMGYILIEDKSYNWNLNSDIPELKTIESGILWAHGHIQNVEGNGLEEVMPRLLTIPTNVEFQFVSEVVGAERADGVKLKEELKQFHGGE